MTGVVKFDDYTFWHKANVVYDYVSDFLENQFMDDIIFPELFAVDFFILKEALPVEVQATRLLFPKKEAKKDRIIIAHSYFEQMIEKQVKQNVNRFGKCWLILDSEYIRYLQKKLSSHSRVNYDWFLKLISDNVLSVWGVDFKGNFIKYSYEDFEFLSNYSTGTLDSIHFDEKSKLKIMYFFLKKYDFSTDEIEKMRINYVPTNEYRQFSDWLGNKREGKTKRESLYGQILRITKRLTFFDSFFDFQMKKLSTQDLHILTRNFGFFEVKGKTRGALFRFEDKFGLAELFPAYLKNKEIWDSLKNKWIKSSAIKEIVTGKISIDKIDSYADNISHNQKEAIRKVLFAFHEFTIEERNRYREEFENDSTKKIKQFAQWLLNKKNDQRRHLLGYILINSTKINDIELFFSRRENKMKINNLSYILKFLGILDSTGRSSNVKVEYVDKFGLAELFENYQKNIEFWDLFKYKKMKYHDFWKTIFKNNISNTLS